jgi:RNA polymerase sigma-70 factor (ECF subfamily)
MPEEADSMRVEESDQHLSRIDTNWTLVRKACQGAAEMARQAQKQLLERYGGAVRRYLGGVVRDGDVADDLFQDFAVRLIRGDFQGVDPERGRFRQYVKAVLFHLIADHHRRKQRLPEELPDGHPGGVVVAEPMESRDQEFVACWRAELLSHGWQTLEQAERKSGQLYYTVLRFRAEHPGLSSAEMAEQLSTQLGKPLTAAGVRQTLHRARERFASQLLREVTESLEEPTPGRIYDELVELGLLRYCQDALNRRAGPS